MHPDFSNTATAFRHLSDFRLGKARLLFETLSRPWLSRSGQTLSLISLKLRLPVSWLIKKSIFEHFCGGENIAECGRVINELGRYGVGTILDYAAEGLESEASFDEVLATVASTVDRMIETPNIPFCVFKVTGLCRGDLLEKVSTGQALGAEERAEYERARSRVDALCRKTAETQFGRIFIDAEESWFQGAIDALAEEMMQRYNRERPVVYQTVQLYRKDRLAYLKNLHADAERKGYFLGLKLVRGAYLEKEAKRAESRGRENPIHASKEDCDRAYDAGLEFCVEKIARVALCAGTHNQASLEYLTKLMRAKGLAPDDVRIECSQLLGMSDNLTFNLASQGYCASKYVPFGKVHTLIPYLIRRAQENSGIQGQMTRELDLIKAEQDRRSGHAHVLQDKGHGHGTHAECCGGDGHKADQPGQAVPGR